MTQANFDVDVAIQALRDGNDSMGKGGVLTPLIKGTSKNRSNLVILMFWNVKAQSHD